MLGVFLVYTMHIFNNTVTIVSFAHELYVEVETPWRRKSLIQIIETRVMKALIKQRVVVYIIKVYWVSRVICSPSGNWKNHT